MDGFLTLEEIMQYHVTWVNVAEKPEINISLQVTDAVVSAGSPLYSYCNIDVTVVLCVRAAEVPRTMVHVSVNQTRDINWPSLIILASSATSRRLSNVSDVNSPFVFVCSVLLKPIALPELTGRRKCPFVSQIPANWPRCRAAAATEWRLIILILCT